MSYLADYELLDWLGPGNSGDWWLARAPQRLQIDESLVAVKALWQDSTDIDFDRMARELRIVASIHSPFLATLIEAGQADGRLFYVRSHYGDGTLADSNRPRSSVLRAMADAARGAQALHDNGVVHRDIKPENVLVGGSGAALAELGLAQLLDHALTTGIGPVGAIEYVSPEVALGDKGTPASDIWSLGVTLHRALTATSIYGVGPPANVLEGFRRVASGRFSLSADLSPDDRSVIEGCLQNNPADRFASATELAEQLTRLEGSSS